jgi:hypothetical protein
VLPSGRIDGDTYDKAKTSSKAIWHSETTMPCRPADPIKPPVTAPVPPASPKTTSVNKQDNWRICRHCYGLFFNGFPKKGACVANGVLGHEAQVDGFNFHLEWGDLEETTEGQINWRYCDKCQQIFFDGFPTKGVCPADLGHSSTGVTGGSGHRAFGYKFRLRHDVPVPSGFQGGWRYCEKCMVMFWDGWERKGRCTSGGLGHKAFGFKFLLETFGAMTRYFSLPDLQGEFDPHGDDEWACEALPNG